MSDIIREPEEWRDIPGYEGFYQVSSWGAVRSLLRRLIDGRVKKGAILKPHITKTGYLRIELNKDRFKQKFGVHQLVAMAFHGHVRSGQDVVPNHKDFDPLNNYYKNIELVPQRTNANHKHLPSNSEYVGVSFSTKINKFVAYIWIKGSLLSLGSFKDEMDAHEAYKRALKILNAEMSKAHNTATSLIKFYTNAPLK